jgi:hypothetical protein
MHIGQALLILLCFLLARFFIFLSVLALLPSDKPISIAEKITVSSSPLTADSSTAYLVQVSGYVKNNTRGTVVIEKITVPLKNTSSGAEGTVVLENIELPAYGSRSLFEKEESQFIYDKVGEITAVVKGEEIFLQNPENTSLTVFLIPAAAALVCVYFLIKCIKKRYYMYQEDCMKMKENA